MKPYHIDVHTDYAYENQELCKVSEPTSLLPRIERIAQRLEKVVANEELHAQIDHCEGIDLGGEENDHSLKALVVLVVRYFPAVHREHVDQDHEDLGWTDDHSHKSPVDGSFCEARCRYQIVGVYISQLGVNIETDRCHHEATGPKEVEEEPRLHPPLELVLDLEHLGNVLAIVVDVATKALVTRKLNLDGVVEGSEGPITLAAGLVVCLVLAICSEVILIYRAIDAFILLTKVNEFEIAWQA